MPSRLAPPTQPSNHGTLWAVGQGKMPGSGTEQTTQTQVSDQTLNITKQKFALRTIFVQNFEVLRQGKLKVVGI